MKTRSKFQQAILLFDQGYKTSFVASKLMIPYKEAQNFYNLYLKSKEVSEETLRGNTNYYLQSLEKDRKECVGKLLSELEVKKKNFGISGKEIDDRLDFILEVFPKPVKVVEIFLFFPGISVPIEWTAEDSDSITANSIYDLLDKMKNNRYN